MKKILILLLVLWATVAGVRVYAIPDPGNPTVQLQDVTGALPGNVEVALSMLNFTGSYGSVGAITLFIDYDNASLTYTGPTYMTYLGGTAVINPNYGPNHLLAINYFNGSGVSPNGVFGVLSFSYTGSFYSDLSFVTASCEIASINGDIFPNSSLTWENGSITPATSTGTVLISPVYCGLSQTCQVPVTLSGAGFTSVKSAGWNISYDPSQLSWQSYSATIPGFTVTASNGTIQVSYYNNAGYDFSAGVIALYFSFVYNGGGTASLDFNSGSFVASGTSVNDYIPTDFVDGSVGVNPSGPFSGTMTIAKVSAPTNTSNVNVPVSTTAISGIGVINLTFLYDTDQLTYEGFTINQSTTGWISSLSAGKIVLIKYLPAPAGFNFTSGDLVTLKFTYTGSSQADIQFGAGCILQDPSGSNIPVAMTNGFVNTCPSIQTQPLSSQTVCQNASPTDLVFALTGGTGVYSYQWFSNTSASNSGGTSLYPAGNASNYTPSTTTDGTFYFYAEATETYTYCSSPLSSSASTVSVDATSEGGSVTGGTNICYGSTSGTLSLSSNVGSIVRWESSTDDFGSVVNNIGNAGSNTYTSGALYSSTQFRAVSKNGVCPEDASSFTSVTVTPLSTVGVSITATPGITISTGQSVTITPTPTNGGSSPVYAWYLNGSPSGSGNTFVSSSLVDEDEVYVVLTSDVVCPDNNPATSNTLIFDVQPIILNTKVILGGGYNSVSGQMNTTLRTKAYFPRSQPYNVSPWNYSGTETLGASTVTVPANVVDWVLVELRTGTASGTIVARKAGFVMADGTIKGLDAVNPLNFPGLNQGNYYIVVRHRNHLAVMSATSQFLNNSSAQYDFTTAINKAYGVNPAMLKSGKAVMVQGDVNSNGVARATGPAIVNDVSLLGAYCGALVKSEYSAYDVNLDGIARATGPAVVNDGSIISTNLGAIVYSSKVPL